MPVNTIDDDLEDVISAVFGRTEQQNRTGTADPWEQLRRTQAELARVRKERDALALRLRRIIEVAGGGDD